MNRSRANRQLILVVAAAVLLAVAAFSANTAFAARPASGGGGGGHKGGGQTGGSGATPTITLDQADPHLGDSVTFTVNTGNTIELMCGQLGAWVFIVQQPVGTSFLLGGTSSAWLSQGGSQWCYAYLLNSTSGSPLAVASFLAGGAR
jgi:hypothetical protein